ncbi:MAG TPA: hypothetical protein VFN14_08950 [Candidatus Limnocylindria bacterium]|nr:hypothetical protein [Candidatus Limnocylindria bacterium]
MSGSRTSVALAALVLLSACGGGNAGTTTGASVVVVPSLPACVPAAERAELPANLDGVLPLPVGTVITSAKLTGRGPLQIAGYVPASLREASAFFREELPKAGFEPGEGDAENDEAEQAFSGHGLDGQWKVHSILDCPDAVSLTIAVSGEPQ